MHTLNSLHILPATIGTRPSAWRNGLAAAALAFAAALPATAQPYVNVTIGGVFAPGVYGQVAVGNNPPPPVFNAVPVIVGPPVVGAGVMYVYAADFEYRDWPRYCNRYAACGRPVYFVRADRSDPWWMRRNDYLRGPGYYWAPPPRAIGHGPRDRDHDRGDRKRGRDNDRDDNRGNRHDRGERRGHER